MSAKIFVVGSGASGVHFTMSLLKKGYNVTMLDVGNHGQAPPSSSSTVSELKEKLEDPARYFLGERFEGVLLPSLEKEYYGIPPSKEFVFHSNKHFQYSAKGFHPLLSFARGGLAETWTGGCYPLNDLELADFPFEYKDIAGFYEEIARRIGISGEVDDLSRFMPVHAELQPPLRLDTHSEGLLEAYKKKRLAIQEKTGVFLGRTRVATLSRDLGERQACDYLGRCLWGCPRGALYTPSQTLRECLRYSTFTYIPGMHVDHFKLGPGGRVRSVVTRPLAGGSENEYAVDRLVLAAGTLASSKIVLNSIRKEGETTVLRGLMDNRQVLVPFINLRMVGREFSEASYQYHLLGMGVQTQEPRDYVHCQITTLKSGMLHPIIQGLPFDMRTATFVTRSMHAALGIVNVNFHDTRRDSNTLTLSADSSGHAALEITYSPSGDEAGRMRDGLRRVRKALRLLGCFVPPGMCHVRPMGASVHYAGTLPMTCDARPLTTTPYCESRDFKDLFLVDGSTFPSLPSKNITFTLMANAARVADAAFSD